MEIMIYIKDNNVVDELRHLYDKIVKEQIPIKITIEPSGLEDYEDSLKAGFIALLAAVKNTLIN